MRLQSKRLGVQIPPGTTFLSSAWDVFWLCLFVFWSSFWLCFVFRRRYPRTLSLFTASVSGLAVHLSSSRSLPPPTLPDLLPFHASLSWFRFYFLFGASLCLCEAEKLDKGRGMCEPATSWRSSERLLLCSGELTRFCCCCCCCCSSSSSSLP